MAHAQALTEAQEEWRKYSARGVDLYSNSSPERSRWLAARAGALLEDYRHTGLFAEASTGNKVAPERPVRMVLFRDFASYLPYRIAADAPAFHIGGMGRSLVLLQDVNEGMDEIVAHEFFHVYADQAGMRLPVWAAEGLADYYSTMRRETGDDGVARLLIGDPVRRHDRMLQISGKTEIEPASLFAVTHDARHRGGSPTAAEFYAECWLVAHLMMTDPRWRTDLAGFLRATGQRSSEAALAAVYSVEPETLRDAARKYRLAGKFTTHAIEVPVDGPVRVAEVELPPWELRLLLADVLAYRGRFEAAHHGYLELKREFPDVPEVRESLAQLALARQNLEEAAVHFAEAARLGSQSGEVYFRLATLRCGMQSEEAQCMDWLKDAMRLNPANQEYRKYAVDFALNMRHFPLALQWMEHPPLPEDKGSFDWLHKQAYALYHMEDFDGARARIEEARALPLHQGRLKMLRDLERAIADREEFSMQMELFREANAESHAPQQRALTRLLERFAGSDNAVIESGWLQEVSCEENALWLLVDSASGRRRLRIENPMDLMVLKGTQRMRELELVCGPAGAAKVRVGYLWDSAAVEGVLRLLQFDAAPDH